MCRSIRPLRRNDGAATTGETDAAAIQFVRKISGYRVPAARNQEAFDAAVAEVSAAAQRLLEAIGTPVDEGPDPWADPAYRQAIIAARGSSRSRSQDPIPAADRA